MEETWKATTDEVASNLVEEELPECKQRCGCLLKTNPLGNEEPHVVICVLTARRSSTWEDA